MKDRGMLLGELETELSESTIGYVTAITVVPGGVLNGLAYNASVYEVVVLDATTVAFRYSDDSVDGAWEVGASDDVINAVIDARNMQRRIS